MTDEEKNIKKIEKLRRFVLSILEEANQYPSFYKCSISDLKTILKDVLSVIEE